MKLYLVVHSRGQIGLYEASRCTAKPTKTKSPLPESLTCILSPWARYGSLGHESVLTNILMKNAIFSKEKEGKKITPLKSTPSDQK
jgi:hypothetical protein